MTEFLWSKKQSRNFLVNNKDQQSTKTKTTEHDHHLNILCSSSLCSPPVLRMNALSAP